jgi:signal transduction histidine kinase
MQLARRFEQSATWRSQPARLLVLTWPLWAITLVNGMALYSLVRSGRVELALPSLMIACAILLIGLLPIICRPNVFSIITGCFAVALATVVGVLPNDNQFWLFQVVEPPRWLHMGGGTLQLANSALLGPLALHLAIVRAPRSPLPPLLMPAIYAITGGAFCGMLFTSPGPWQLAAHLLVLLGFTGTLAATGWLLLYASRFTDEPTRLAPEARLMLISLLLAEFPLLLAPFLALAELPLPMYVLLGSQVLLPIGVALAALRHDLLELDTTVRRALSYGALSLFVLALYLGMSSLLTFVLSRIDQPLRGVAILGGLLAAALAFTPLRLRSEQAIERLFYPERASFQQAISSAQHTMARVIHRQSVIDLLNETFPRQIGVGWAQLDLHPPLHDPAPEHWAHTLRVGERVLGHYRLGMRKTGLPYSSTEQNQLVNLLQQAALALAYAETVDALTQLNSELEERVAARTDQVLAQQRELIALEERQRLARDLHDSVKQTLFSLGLGLRAVRGLLQSDQQTALHVLHEQEQTVVQAQSEMGNLLASLRETTYGSLDLMQLLTNHCNDLAHRHALEVQIVGPPKLYLPEQLANELLRIVREALHNVLKHSGVQLAQVQLDAQQASIRLCISDQGRGFAQGSVPEGLGLRGIAERVAALGGQWELQSAIGAGTHVVIVVPMRPEPVEGHEINNAN